ncbi:MAG: hypothetical protein AAGN82_26825 [Myxococcota bacterium]
MASYAYHLANRRYKVGYDSIVCSSPRQIEITGLNPKTETTGGDPYPISHYLARKFERGATSQEVLDAIRHPAVCLNQWGGKRVLYLTPEMAVVLKDDGILVIVWTREQFDDDVRRLLADAGY